MRVRIGPDQTAYVGYDDKSYYGWCIELSEAEGSGRTVQECIDSIRESVRAIEQKRGRKLSASSGVIPGSRTRRGR